MIKYSKSVITFCAIILIGYSFHFSNLLLAVWAGIAVLSVFVSEKNPHLIFFGLAATSFILNYVVKYQQPEASVYPHGEILTLIPFIFLGAGIDGLYWVKKWDRGAKVKTGYDN
jgi:hypothetical protein